MHCMCHARPFRLGLGQFAPVCELLGWGTWDGVDATQLLSSARDGAAISFKHLQHPMAATCSSPPPAASRRAPLSETKLDLLRRAVAMRKHDSLRAIAAKAGISEAALRRRIAADDWTPKRLGRAPLLDPSSKAFSIGLMMHRWSEGRGMTQKTMRLEASKFMTPT